MKHLVESIVNESEMSELDVLGLMDCLNGDADFDEWDISDEDADFLKKHCKVFPPLGGYDGDGSDAITALEGKGVDLSAIDKRYEDKDIYDVIEDGYPASPKVVKEFGRVMKFPAKTGSVLYCGGFEAPAVVLFDVPKAKAMPYMDKIIPFS